MRSQLINPPSIEPVTVDEARLQAHVDLTIEDDLLTLWIAAAREACENDVERAFVTQTWETRLDCFPREHGTGYWDPWIRKQGPDYPGFYPTSGRGLILLPRPNLQEVVSIEYFDQHAALQTLDPAAYRVSLGTPGRIQPLSTWPTTARLIDAVVITWQAGYTPLPGEDDPYDDFTPDLTKLPPCIRPTILAAVAHFYLNREPTPLPRSVSRMLDAIRWKL